MEEELEKISITDLQYRTQFAKLIIFGGIGFSGMNETFNANNGLYKYAIDRELEKKESLKFLNLYKKVINALKNSKLIVITHMPFQD